MSILPILPSAMMLFLVMDPIGSVPVFAALLKNVDPRRRTWVIFRENLVALAVFVFFLALGPTILHWLHIEEPALNIAGGLVLLIIALEMIFPGHGGRTRTVEADEEPFIVPLAIPMLAGPSTMALIMLMVSREPDLWPQWLAAILIAWGAGLVILIPAGQLERLLGPRGLAAVERLMGMILIVVAVQMAMTGVEGFVEHLET